MEEKLIRERTGHKSSALIHYERPYETQLKNVVQLWPRLIQLGKTPSFDTNVLSITVKTLMLILKQLYNYYGLVITTGTNRSNMNYYSARYSTQIFKGNS